MEAYIAIAAMFISLLTFIVTQLKSQKAASIDELQNLRAQVVELKKDIERNESRIAELESENIRLLRKIVAGGMV